MREGLWVPRLAKAAGMGVVLGLEKSARENRECVAGNISDGKYLDGKLDILMEYKLTKEWMEAKQARMRSKPETPRMSYSHPNARVDQKTHNNSRTTENRKQNREQPRTELGEQPMCVRPRNHFASFEMRIHNI